MEESEQDHDNQHRRLCLPLRIEYRRRCGLRRRRRLCGKAPGVVHDLPRPGLHLLGARAGADQEGHPRIRAQPYRRGLLLPAAARAHVPQVRERGGSQPLPHGDGQHPGAVLLGAQPRSRGRPRPRPGIWCAPPLPAHVSWMSARSSRCRCARATLVIGGGVAGIQAALDLADAGYPVVLVEKQPSIGGIMAQLDKTFPTMDCSI